MNIKISKGSFEKSCVFGRTSNIKFSNYKNYELNQFGRMCRMSKFDLDVLAKEGRSLLSKVTDVLLVEPIGSFIFGVSRTSYVAENNIALRKHFTAALFCFFVELSVLGLVPIDTSFSVVFGAMLFSFLISSGR